MVSPNNYRIPLIAHLSKGIPSVQLYQIPFNKERRTPYKCAFDVFVTIKCNIKSPYVLTFQLDTEMIQIEYTFLHTDNKNFISQVFGSYILQNGGAHFQNGHFTNRY